MICQAFSQHKPMQSNRGSRVADMGSLSEDVVSFQLGNKAGDPTIITVNCPDQLGLCCDLVRLIFEFGLNVVRGDFSTDGRWCLLLYWVSPRLSSARPIKWALLKTRLVLACPSTRAPLLQLPISQSKKEVYLLQACSADRIGLLNDMAQTLWELELDVHQVNMTTTPDGSAIHLFYLTDARNSLQNKKRQADVCHHVRTVLGDSCSFCELQLANPDCAALDDFPISSLQPTVVEDLLGEKTNVDSEFSRSGAKFSVDIDNSLSPGHSLLQITFRDRRGLLYDCMRTLKDLDIQVAYGRLSTTSKGSGDLDLFILRADGSKMCDPYEQKMLLSRLQLDMCDPIRVKVVNKGPDTELLVATPVEKSGRVRPRVLYDVTLVLKMLGICIFKADIGKLPFGVRVWEVYRFLLADQPGSMLTNSRTRSHIAERVQNVLMG